MPVIIILVVLAISAYIAAQFYDAACEKGYGSIKYFMLSWLLGPVGYMLVIALPDRGGNNDGSDEESMPLKQCPNCGKYHDFDYPKCPYCEHKYE